MAHKLKTLKVNEISLVDRPANAGARVLLMKRHDAIDAYLKRDLFAEATEAAKVAKREFSADERKTLAESGKALPDGSFPIATKQDLHNAQRAIGRAKDPAKAKAHIRARARSLGLTNELSDAFKRASTDCGLFKILKMDGDAAVLFDDAHDDIEMREYADAMMSEFCEAFAALGQSVQSILDDGSVADKKSMIDETIAQFTEHVQGVVPEELEKQLIAASIAAAVSSGDRRHTNGDHVMTAELKKALGLGADATDAQINAAVTKLATDAGEIAGLKKSVDDLTTANKALTANLAVAKMSDAHKDFMDKAEMSDADKEKFKAMAPGERDDHMSKHPINKKLPADVQKRLDDADADRATLRILKRKDTLATFTKRAVEIGLPENFGEVLMKASDEDDGDADDKKKKEERKKAFGQLEDHIKGLTAQLKTGGLFKEFGKAGGAATGGTAYEQLQSKAAELRKSDPKLSEAQAFAKAYEDPANRELVTLHKSESAPRAAA